MTPDQSARAIKELNPTINAVITPADPPVSSTSADLKIPILIKDCMDVAGLPTTYGSAIRKNAKPATAHAEVVKRALAAGAVVMGKANLNEYCFGATGENVTFGDCRNPWDTNRITGGSSGGSAASVASGMVRMALGTDTGGSVRVPAALCGVVGLRPTLGRVSNTGCLEVSTISDTIGPLAATVREAAWLYDAIQGYDPADPLSINEGPPALKTLEDGVQGLRIGVLGGFFAENIQPEIADSIAEAARHLEAMGATIKDITPEDNDARREHHAFRFILADVADARADLMADASTRDMIGPEVRRRIEMGQKVTGAEYAASIRALLRLKRWLRNVFNTEADLLLLPTTPVTAPLWADSRDMVETTRKVALLTYDLGASGIPSISVPIGRDNKGLPIGAMIAAPWGADALVLQAARAIEKAVNFTEVAPNRPID
jgi:aspartyl-tRNA(Asn)/glutamyl-tRNA(Gln) amidotransferase subunit A